MNQPKLKWESSVDGWRRAFETTSGQATLYVDNSNSAQGWSLIAFLPDDICLTVNHRAKPTSPSGTRINGMILMIVDAVFPLTNDATAALVECERLTREAMFKICGELLSGA